MGRYEGLAEYLRLCPFCNVLENEIHAIINCRVYEDLRDTLFRKASECTFNFDALSDEQKCVVLFSNPDLVRICAKTSFSILQRRQFLTCK